ncbi:zf-HC2 domain-containing protein [Ramlibacter sp.]|uniref:zf-HC2 domain-containing protein n=1 Tax=Ramlibacter sp. TaxID=1917967 RepID=UPI002FCBC282
MTQHDLDCEQALSRLFDFLDHELDGDERDAMQRHLATCRSCWSRADFERRLKAKLRETRPLEPAARAVGRIRRLLQTF